MHPAYHSGSAPEFLSTLSSGGIVPGGGSPIASAVLQKASLERAPSHVRVEPQGVTTSLLAPTSSALVDSDNSCSTPAALVPAQERAATAKIQDTRNYRATATAPRRRPLPFRNGTKLTENDTATAAAATRTKGNSWEVGTGVVRVGTSIGGRRYNQSLRRPDTVGLTAATHRVRPLQEGGRLKAGMRVLLPGQGARDYASLLKGSESFKRRELESRAVTAEAQVCS